MKSGTKIKVPYYPLIVNKNIHLLEYKKIPFIYFVYSTRTAEIDQQSAFIIRQLLKSNGKNEKRYITLDCGPYDSRELETAYSNLMKELNDLIDEEIYEFKQERESYELFMNNIKNHKEFLRWRQKIYTDYYIYLTRSCNMACHYCWNQGGLFNEKKPPELDRKKIKQIMDFIFKDSMKRKVINIILFGGEPLLLDIELLEYLFKYGQYLAAKEGKHLDYTLDTNGTIWNDQIEKLLKKYKVYIMVSIDGTREQHDSFRVFKNGKPTHKIIARNIKKMIKVLPDQIGGRAVLGDSNFNLLETYEFMRNMNFAEIKVKYYCFSGYVGDSQKARVQPISTINKFKKQIDNLTEDTLRRIKEGRNSQLDADFHVSILNRICNYNSFYRCFMGLTQLVIQTDGKIYPCPQIYTDDFCLGNIKDGIVRWDLLKYYAQKTLFTMDRCQNCWAKYACGGCCIGASFVCEGEEDKPIPVSCERTRYEIKAISYLISEINKFAPSIIKELVKGYNPYYKSQQKL